MTRRMTLIAISIAWLPGLLNAPVATAQGGRATKAAWPKALGRCRDGWLSLLWRDTYWTRAPLKFWRSTETAGLGSSSSIVARP